MKILSPRYADKAKVGETYIDPGNGFTWGRREGGGYHGDGRGRVIPNGGPTPNARPVQK